MINQKATFGMREIAHITQYMINALDGVRPPQKIDLLNESLALSFASINVAKESLIATGSIDYIDNLVHFAETVKLPEPGELSDKKDLLLVSELPTINKEIMKAYTESITIALANGFDKGIDDGLLVKTLIMPHQNSGN